MVLSCLSAVGLSTSPSVKSLVSIAESDVRKVLAHANPEVAKACIDTALASHLIPRFSALFVSAFYYDEVQEQVEASRACKNDLLARDRPPDDS